MLKAGMYDWWKDQFEAHVCALDGQLWKIIERGPLEILDKTDSTNPVEKKREDYKDDDYKKLERNMRAKKVLYSALSSEDQVKISAHKSAKDMHEALERLYGGNKETKRNRIQTSSEDYEKIEKGYGESLHDFYTRFQTVLGELRHLGEVYLEWKITTHFLQALGPQWEASILALQSSSKTFELTLEELVTSLHSQSNITEQRLVRRAGKTKFVQTIALKAGNNKSKVREESSSESENEEEDDDIALLTRALAKFGKSKFFKKGSGSKEHLPPVKKELMSKKK